MGGGVAYHERTAYRRGALGGGFLDWNARPKVFKTYHGLPEVPLSWDIEGSSKPFFQVLFDPIPERTGHLDFKTLSRVLRLSYGITAQSGTGADAFYFRSVPSAGALYPCELYAAVQGVRELDDGLYHYDLARSRLVRLRSGSFLASKALPTAAFFITTMFFRSAWKYRDRAYRYCLLDAGHLVENALLVLRSEGFKACVYDRFNDAKLNAFLGVDTEREACVAVIGLPSKAWAGEAAEPLNSAREFSLMDELRSWDPVQPEACRLSPVDAVPHAILEAHRTTEGGAPLRGAGEKGAGEEAKDFVKEVRKIPRPEVLPEGLSFAECVWRRRSHRNYVSARVTKENWQTLWHSLRLDGALSSCVQVIIACGETDGLPPGVYAWNVVEEVAQEISGEDIRRSSARACLDQGWLKQALFHVIFHVFWTSVHERFGPRGYRSAMLDAGRLGQRVYLASTALGLGCCGIGAYYDEELRSLFHLGSGCDVVYLTASGPVKKLRS
ncbi:SagB-type dehydrogenase family enzyme [Desulfosoma caldarium]|uniref:SagB-type dehydrogenase family enzyme n=1 Tax=Desulfosoma caldarium TaxID=610254 RepID=A0A3N1VU26_9BACT|nr:SagB-type dehydrogenase family enzyme [Desulfosoma caldarium]